MPFPLIGILAALTGLGGAALHATAKETAGFAEDKIRGAKEKYARTREALESERQRMEAAWQQFEATKSRVYGTSVKRYLAAADKLRDLHINRQENRGGAQLIPLDEQEVLRLRALSDIYGAAAGGAVFACAALLLLALLHRAIGLPYTLVMAVLEILYIPCTGVLAAVFCVGDAG